MGLSIVYSILQSYGGNVSAESELGKGTSFYLYFPVTNDVETLDALDSGSLPQGPERILFVDDEEIYTVMQKESLERLGYKVDVYQSSLDALAAFKASPHKYNLIITDQVMPDLSGEDLVKEAHAIRNDIPIILCTGYSSQMNEEKARELGIFAFTYKPVSRREMAKLIRDALD